MYARKFQQFVRVPLPIAGDFALKPLRAPHDEDFDDLVAARYERAATILTCANGETPSQTIASSAQPRLTAYATVAIHRFSRSSSRLKHGRPLTATAPFFSKHVPKPFISR